MYQHHFAKDSETKIPDFANLDMVKNNFLSVSLLRFYTLWRQGYHTDEMIIDQCFLFQVIIYSHSFLAMPMILVVELAPDDCNKIGPSPVELGYR